VFHFPDFCVRGGGDDQLPVTIADAVTPFGVAHFNIVELIAGDDAGPHFHAVLPTDNNLFSVFIPFINTGRADPGTLLFLAVKADLGVLDFEMGLGIHTILVKKKFVFELHDFTASWDGLK